MGIDETTELMKLVQAVGSSGPVWRASSSSRLKTKWPGSKRISAKADVAEAAMRMDLVSMAGFEDSQRGSGERRLEHALWGRQKPSLPREHSLLICVHYLTLDAWVESMRLSVIK